MMRRSRRGSVNLALTAAIVAIPVVGLLERNALYDAFRLHGYMPPAAVANLATQDTMTAYSQHLFYVNHPQLESDSAAFRADCTVTEQTIILGCYHPIERGIYVYNVTDTRLAGVQQVTAAHEMLHAAYDRLSASDKKYVDGLLQDYFDHDLHDQRILDTMASYKKTEPNDVVNEMHSVFGTEIANLPAPLEHYYQRYFTNRAAVVVLSQNYENEFTTRSAKAAQYEAQINSLKDKIAAEETDLKAQLAKINSDQARLDSERNSGQTAQYNADVPGYNAEVDAYNAGVAQYKRDVNNYNALVAQYNAVAGELKQLYGALDANLQTK